MYTLFKKEIHTYFTSLTGYLIIGFFLVLTSLFLWFLPDTSVLESGYANLDVFFTLSPYLFLFLIPALTMRTFSGEKAEGTFDLLRSRPLSVFEILLGKYLAVLVLVCISILPTFIYSYSLYKLASPTGNIDIGGLIGSYIGLLLLSFSFCAIGLFCSSVSKNPVVSFLLAALISFFFFDGFSALSTLDFWSDHEQTVAAIGIKYHYDSVSRGVLSIIDFVYFLSLAILFLGLTLFFINKAFYSKKEKIRFFILFAGLVLVVNIPSIIGLQSRWDFTLDKRHTLSETSKKILKSTDQNIYFTLFLDGKLPTDFQRLKEATLNHIKDFQRFANGNIYFNVIDPLDETNGDPEEWIQSLSDRGLAATNINMRSASGNTQKIIFPGLIIHTEDMEIPVNLLQDRNDVSYEEVLNNSIENLEYSLLSGIQKVMQSKLPIIAFTEGNGEPEDIFLDDAIHTLALSNQTGRVNLDSISLEDITKLDVLILAKPTQALSEAEKYKINYFIQQGGHTIWAIDKTDADLDSLRKKNEKIVDGRDLHIDDMLFLYGVRINYDVIVDLQSGSIPLSVGKSKQIELFPWYFNPILLPTSHHPIVKNLGGIRTAFVSSIDTLENNIDKEVLLSSSPYSNTLKTGQIISLAMAEQDPDPNNFLNKALPVAVLLEGEFPDVFENRSIPKEFSEVENLNSPSQKAKMLVISDGDWLLNDVHSQDHSPYPLGWDKYINHQFANKAFLLNVIDYFLNDESLISLRNRHFKLMLLDKAKVKSEKAKWQIINILSPLLLLVFGGLVFSYSKKRRYGKRRF